jgi:hypothetical protein
VLAVWDPSARDIPISDKVRRHAEPQVDWLFLELELLWLLGLPERCGYMRCRRAPLQQARGLGLCRRCVHRAFHEHRDRRQCPPE